MVSSTGDTEEEEWRDQTVRGLQEAEWSHCIRSLPCTSCWLALGSEGRQFDLLKVWSSTGILPGSNGGGEHPIITTPLHLFLCPPLSFYLLVTRSQWMRGIWGLRGKWVGSWYSTIMSSFNSLKNSCIHIMVVKRMKGVSQMVSRFDVAFNTC